MKSNRRFYPLFMGCCFILILSSIFTLGTGEIPWNKVWEGCLLRFQGKSQAWNPLLDERIPRLIVLICTGAALATSGVVLQSLFHNPLASPSILGISSGGCLAVIIIFVWDLRLHYPYIIPFAAFMGCLITLCIVYALSCLQKGNNHLTHLILTGIAISSLLIAIQGMILYALRDHWQLIQMFTEWEAGSTRNLNWQHVHMQFPLTLVGLWGCWTYREELNLLALGEEEAVSLGLDVKRIRWRLFLCIALLTGGALASVGTIAFFGLILPHMMRRLQGPDHFTLVPLCMWGGAAVFVLMDCSLRSLALHNISLGNLSAVVGGIFFLFLLFQPPRKGLMHEL